jgi:N-sulfoglucosamine sulfohydrolase
MNRTFILGLGLLPVYACSDKTGSSEERTNPTRPNILFCIADDASFQHFSANGSTWVSTPGFDKVAREGILFTNAYTPNAKSAPSRASIITGRNSWQLEEAANHICNFPPHLKSFIEVLKEHGYFTGHTAKGWAPGNPGTVEGKPRELTGKAYNKNTTTPPTDGINRIDYAANFNEFLDERSPGSPWFFWYGSTEPHRRYQYGSGVSMGGKNTGQIEKVPRFWPDNDTVRNDMLDYAFEIEYFDRQLVKMIEEIERRGELENTVVVVTSDNGMPFPRCKGLQYEYSNHMPLAIMWLSGIKDPGRISTDYISFIDFAPTFLELAGVDWSKSGMAASPGKSLSDIFIKSEKLKDRSYILLGQERHDYGRPLNQGYPVRSIIKDGFLFQINFKPDLWPAGNPETGYLNTDGSPTKTFILNQRRNGTDISYWKLCFGKHSGEELYNLNIDPECLTNLASAKSYQEVKDELKSILMNDLQTQNDPRIIGNGDVFDNYPFDNPEDWNFYERFMNKEIKKYQTNWVNPGDYEKNWEIQSSESVN